MGREFDGCLFVRAAFSVPRDCPRRGASRGTMLVRAPRGLRAFGRGLGPPGGSDAGGLRAAPGIFPRAEGGAGRGAVLVPAPDRRRDAPGPRRLLTGGARSRSEGGGHEGAPPVGRQFGLRGSQALDRTARLASRAEPDQRAPLVPPAAPGRLLTRSRRLAENPE